MLIADLTNESNPTMFAYQAHKIDSKHRKQIIKIMQKYDEDFNTNWERTDDSLLIEWKEHHKYSFFHERAQNIDFDNKEEGRTERYFFMKAVRAGMEMLFG